jgi:predicted nucleic-acid-binding Zn-ribbon protein
VDITLSRGKNEEEKDIANAGDGLAKIIDNMW